MSPAEAAALRASAARLGLTLEEAASDRIGRFLDLLGVWNQRFHLTGERDRRILLRKHVVDALAPARWVPNSGVVVDVGSGAGFPGVVLACVRPAVLFYLVEARRRPCSFLGEVARSLPLPNIVPMNARAEEVANGRLNGSADVVISRAIRLDAFVPLAKPFLTRTGVIVAMRTPGGAAEEARVATSNDLAVRDAFEYVLPDGEARRLVLLVHQSDGASRA